MGFYTKLPVPFKNFNLIQLTQGRHTQAWGNMSADVAIDFGYTGELISPFDDCEVILFDNSDNGRQSYFGLRLPDSTILICVHGYPVRTGKFAKGETVGLCRWHHWHLSLLVQGRLACVLDFLERLPMESKVGQGLYDTNNHSDADWATYKDATLLLPDQYAPKAVQVQPPVVEQPKMVSLLEYENIKSQLNQSTQLAADIEQQSKATKTDLLVARKEIDDLGAEINSKTDEVYQLTDRLKEYAEANQQLTKENQNLKSATAKAKEEPALKNFLDSKKIKVFLLTYGANILIAAQAVSTILNTPDLYSKALLGATAIGGMFGLSFAGGKYLDNQGAIDLEKQKETGQILQAMTK